MQSASSSHNGLKMVQIIRLLKMSTPAMTLEMDLVHFITCVKCERIFYSGLDVTDHLEEYHKEMSIPNEEDEDEHF